MTTQLVTPEAVVIGFDTAGLPTRMLARMIDVGVQLVVVVAVLFGLGFLSGSGVSDVALTIAAFFLVPLVVFGYPIALETLWRGRTLGKAALGLRVVTVEGAPIRFRHALIRGGADIVDLLGLGVLLVAPGIIGVIAISVSKRNQRLGDIVAGTIVVRERAGATRTQATAFTLPPGTEAYAATVDVSGLDGRSYQAIRSYLLRASSLRAEARQHVSTELARSIAARIRHVPPPGVSPDLFLAVVAANVQSRGGPRPVAVTAPFPGGRGTPPAARPPPGAGGWGTGPAAPGEAAGSAVPVPGGWGAVPAWPGAAPLPPPGAPAGGPPAPPPRPPAGSGHGDRRGGPPPPTGGFTPPP